MSARTAAAVRAPRRAPVEQSGARTRPRLEVVTSPEVARSRIPFVVLCMSLLVGALLSALLLNTAMADGTFKMTTTQVELGRAAQDAQDLKTQVEQARASLPERARALGMREAEDPLMLRVSDGAVLGAGEGGKAP